MSVISSKILPRPQTTQDRDLYVVLDSLITETKSIINGGILFSDNFAAKMVTFTSNATPDSEDAVAHGLGKIPSGYIVYGRDKAGILYTGTTSWTATNIYLKSNVASTTYKILVF